ncbi:DUF3616 domain-containing protein [Pontibacter sp. CAU 1760]
MNEKIRLQFDEKQSRNPEGKHVRNGLSTALRTGNSLWLSCDERITIERLTLNSEGEFGNHKSFDLSDFIELPGGNTEIDIEGMALAGHYIWIIGSHSLKRKKPHSHDPVPKQIKSLAKIKNDPNRYLLARIPVAVDEATNEYTLLKECKHPDQPDRILRAAQLRGTTTSSLLTDALQNDEHIGPFLAIPSKDNGLDIEGLTTSDDRIFIGLRGPVLRGWAIVLEIETEEDEQGTLHLKQLTKQHPYKKHFLHLQGKGIRELRIFGNDMYILAGPTMDQDGVIAMYRWPGALTNTAEESMVHKKDLERLCEIPHGTGAHSGKDKAEGLAIHDDKHVLVVFDSPIDERLIGENGVLADIIQVVS